MDKSEIVKRAKEGMPSHPGVAITTAWSQRAEDGNSIRIGLMGPDSARLQKIAREVAWRIEQIDGVVSAQPEADDNTTRELQLTVDRELATHHGLTPLIVGGAVDLSLRGRRMADFHDRDGDTPLYVMGPEENRNSVADLDALSIADPRGGPGTPISRLTRRSVAPTYHSINRQDGRTLSEIEIVGEGDDLTALGEKIDAALEGYALPAGYEISLGERFERLEANESERNFALSLAVLLVFLLMGVLFESIVLPLSILVSIPFALVGAYWTLYLSGTPFDVMAGIGMVMLVGIVVNNAVVLVDLVGQLRRTGTPRREAILEAGRRRLRPILMTALTTICGLMPMATGTASIVGIPYQPLGRALIGGLAASTVFTLLVVPLFYTIFDDLREHAIDLIRWRPSPRGREA
jgi:HAE1 family hydrophobic/amphiphilic exporter-1